jgi:hypothetical protein
MKISKDLELKLYGVLRDVREAMHSEVNGVVFFKTVSPKVKETQCRRRRQSALRRANKTLLKLLDITPAMTPTDQALPRGGAEKAPE